MRKLCVAALLVVSAVSSRADTLETNRGMPLREISHTVDIRIENGVAIYTVQRQFKNAGKQADEVRLAIDLPKGSAATGLRIKAKHKWHAGDLLEADLAATRYQELTGQGVFDPKDPALLYWVSQSELFLQMFPVFPGTVSTVEYTLKAPTTYDEGRYWISYPRAPKELVRPVITVRSPRSIVVDGKSIAGTRATLPWLPRPADPDTVPQDTDGTDDTDDDAPVLDLNHSRIGIAPPAIATWAARLARVVVSDPHAFTRLELDVAPQLSQIPRRAQVLFVIDASFSAAELMPTQLAVIRQYAKHAPDAEIEVIAFRRTASRVFNAFVPARELERALASAKQRGALALGNGSALEAGARLAAQVIAKRTGARRVVITTDERLRGSLTNEAAIASLATLDPATVVHLVIPSLDDGAGTRLERDDQSALAALATKHRGIYARLHGTTHGPNFTRAVLELVRPLRIHYLTATGNFTIADTVEEGHGVRLFESRTKADAPAQITLTGKLWGESIKLDVTPTRPFDTATAAFVFGDGLHIGLDTKEQMTLALVGRAVSPVTSYLAIEPGVRPSRIGLEGGGTGWGTIGTGRYGTIGHGTHGVMRSQPDLQALIKTQACVATHKPAAGWGVKLAIETTDDEVVDVAIKNGFGPLADCLVETVWNLRLDSRFNQPRENFVVDLF